MEAVKIPSPCLRGEGGRRPDEANCMRNIKSRLTPLAKTLRKAGNVAEDVVEHDFQFYPAKPVTVSNEAASPPNPLPPLPVNGAGLSHMAFGITFLPPLPSTRGEDGRGAKRSQPGEGLCDACVLSTNSPSPGPLRRFAACLPSSPLQEGERGRASQLQKPYAMALASRGRGIKGDGND